MYGSLVIPGPQASRIRNAVANAVEEAWFATANGTVHVGRFDVRRQGDVVAIGDRDGDLFTLPRQEAEDKLVKLLSA